MIPLLIKYRHLVAIGLVVAAFMIFVVATYNKGYNDGKAKELGKCNTEKVEAINHNVEILKKQKRVVRPDNVALINSMLGGSF